MKCRPFVWCVIVAMGCVVAPPARATVVLPADLDELVRGAQAILRGQVVRVRARERDDRRVERLVTVRAITYYKGNLGNRVDFRVPGGTVGRYRTVMVGAPEYAEGEELVLFLNARGSSLPHVLGLFQGTYRVSTGAGQREPMVVAEGFRASARTRSVARGAGARGPVALSTFEARLQQLIARAEADGAGPDGAGPDGAGPDGAGPDGAGQ